MNIRTLKVRSGHYDYMLKNKPNYYVPPPVPFILIKGYWLKKVNFAIGKTVRVEVRENQLILTVGPS